MTNKRPQLEITEIFKSVEEILKLIEEGHLIICKYLLDEFTFIQKVEDNKYQGGLLVIREKSLKIFYVDKPAIEHSCKHIIPKQFKDIL